MGVELVRTVSWDIRHSILEDWLFVLVDYECAVVELVGYDREAVRRSGSACVDG